MSTEPYPDLIAVVCIPLIISILGIAFPLLSSSANKIQSKYKSRSIAKAFDKETTIVLFKFWLYSSLIAIVLWVFQFPAPYVDNHWLQIVLENSAVILLLISSIILVIYLFGYISLLKTYHNPDLLINRITRTKENGWFKKLCAKWAAKLTGKWAGKWADVKHEICRKTRTIISKVFKNQNKDKQTLTKNEIKTITQVSELLYSSIKNDDETISRSIISGVTNFAGTKS